MSKTTKREDKSGPTHTEPNEDNKKPRRIYGASGAVYYDNSRGNCLYCGEMGCRGTCPQALYTNHYVVVSLPGRT